MNSSHLYALAGVYKEANELCLNLAQKVEEIEKTKIKEVAEEDGDFFSDSTPAFLQSSEKKKRGRPSQRQYVITALKNSKSGLLSLKQLHDEFIKAGGKTNAKNPCQLVQNLACDLKKEGVIKKTGKFYSLI